MGIRIVCGSVLRTAAICLAAGALTGTAAACTAGEPVHGHEATVRHHRTRRLDHPGEVRRLTLNDWAGYSMAARDITGIRARWVEPQVSGFAKSSVYLWVGIGSWNAEPVVQTGTYVIFPGGQYEDRGSWYERYPRDPAGITGRLQEYPGDTIAASVTLLPGSAGRWRLSVRDITVGLRPWTKTVTYKIEHDDADFIVEDPSVNSAGKLAPFARWGTVTFTRMQVRVGSHWHAAAALRSLRFTMIQHKTTIAAASPLQPSGTSYTADQH